MFRSAIDYHEAYKAKVVTPLQVVETLLPLIRRDVEGAKHSVAFLSTKVALVRKAAEESTARYAAGKFLSVLDGVPTVRFDPMLMSESDPMVQFTGSQRRGRPSW